MGSSESLESSHPHTLGQPVILVVDDEEMLRNIVILLLRAQGYAVLSASDGQEALELSRKHSGTIDLVITDVDMPKLKGPDLCAHLLKERPGIKVIVMSGADTKSIVSQNINLQLLLPKPFLGQALVQRVQAILNAPISTLEQRPNQT